MWQKDHTTKDIIDLSNRIVKKWKQSDRNHLTMWPHHIHTEKQDNIWFDKIVTNCANWFELFSFETIWLFQVSAICHTIKDEKGAAIS